MTAVEFDREEPDEENTDPTYADPLDWRGCLVVFFVGLALWGVATYFILKAAGTI